MLLIRCWYSSGFKSNISCTLMLRTNLMFEESQNWYFKNHKIYFLCNVMLLELKNIFPFSSWLGVGVCVSACVCLADEWVVDLQRSDRLARQTEVAHKVMNTTYHWESHLKVHTVLTWKLRYTHFSQYTNF